jgi:hypothetical protein
MGDIINLDKYRQDKEAEEVEALDKERQHLGQTLRSLLSRIALVEERADRVGNREGIRETRRETDEASLAGSWFSRAFRPQQPEKEDPDD